MTSKSSINPKINISLKSIILSIILVIALTASNAYLGLKLGTTISASIPAVVIAMGVFRMFRQYSVQEINLVQTAAAAGEGITAGIAFTLPALIIMHFWGGFNYWQTTFLSITGGIMGVLFSIPLRRALLSDETLPFPEGTAIGQVMKASTDNSNQVKPIIRGGFVGAVIALCQGGFGLLAQGYDYWIIKSNMVFGYSLGFSPAVIAAGYICGITVAVSIIVGILLGWVMGIPLLSHLYGFPHSMQGTAIANKIWADKLRYIGVGTMLIGGLWTLVTLFKPVIYAVKSSITALKVARSGKEHTIKHTERDIPINIVLWGTLCVAAALFAILFSHFSPTVLGTSPNMHITVIILCTLFFFIAGFILSAISGYFAGLVGATNSPGSGLLISALLLLSMLLLAVVGSHVDLTTHSAKAVAIAGLSVMVCSFVGAAITMTNESIQIAKTGAIIKSAPWFQQTTLICGLIIASLTLPLVLTLLFNAYGIGGVFPHPGMSHSQMLSAPQAGLMAAIAQGVLAGHIPWTMIFTGAVIAIICVIIDEFLKSRSNSRLLVLAVGLGIYLPLNVSAPTALGGVISYLAHKKLRAPTIAKNRKEKNKKKSLQNAVFLACGLVAGSTIMGVILAIPFAIFKSTGILRLVPNSFDSISWILSIIVTFWLCYWIYKTATKK